MFVDLIVRAFFLLEKFKSLYCPIIFLANKILFTKCVNTMLTHLPIKHTQIRILYYFQVAKKKNQLFFLISLLLPTFYK